MEDKKRETFKIKRETHEVSKEVKDNLKYWNQTKKKIIEAFGEEELSIPEISAKLNMSKADTLYYVMSLLKFGVVQTCRIDDMDEYYIYKLKK
jgi:predicted transcriptional regulator